MRPLRCPESRVSGPTHLTTFRVVPSPEPLALLGLPLQAWPRVAESGLLDPARGSLALGTPDELTLMLPWGHAPVARGLFPGIRVDGPFRLLTLDVTDDGGSRVPPDVLPRILTALADAGVDARVTTSLERDHFLVAEAHADRAVEVLQQLAST